MRMRIVTNYTYSIWTKRVNTYRQYQCKQSVSSSNRHWRTSTDYLQIFMWKIGNFLACHECKATEQQISHQPAVGYLLYFRSRRSHQRISSLLMRSLPSTGVVKSLKFSERQRASKKITVQNKLYSRLDWPLSSLKEREPPSRSCLKSKRHLNTLLFSSLMTMRV